MFIISEASIPQLAVYRDVIATNKFQQSRANEDAITSDTKLLARKTDNSAIFLFL